jgi:hypothetical protein
MPGCRQSSGVRIAELFAGDGFEQPPFHHRGVVFEDDIEVFPRRDEEFYPDQVSFWICLICLPFVLRHKRWRCPHLTFSVASHGEFLGLRDKSGRLQMILDNNNDISEDWEWLDRGNKSMHEARTSLEFGINDVIYAMTH